MENLVYLTSITGISATTDTDRQECVSYFDAIIFAARATASW